MEDEDSKIHAKLLLEGFGYVVESIPVSENLGERRADLKATLDTDVLVVEAKGKAPHYAYVELIREARSKGLGTLSREITSWNGLWSVVEKAAQQLNATTAAEPAARSLFISCIHTDAGFVFEAFRHCLYGEVDLALWSRTDGLPQQRGIRRCFYYESSAFVRYTELDAVIFAGPEGSQMLVNEFGTRLNWVRRSRLYAEYQKAQALHDPEAERKLGKALAVLSHRRLEPLERHTYLLENYGFMTNPMKSYLFNGLIVISI